MRIRRILIVENDPQLQPMIDTRRSALPGMKVEPCPATGSAKNHIRTMDYSVIITPLLTPQIGGLQVLCEAKRLQPRTPVLLMADLPEWQASRADLIAAAYDVLLKPVDHDMLCMALRRAAHTHALRWGEHRAATDGCFVIVRGLSNKATIEVVKLLFSPIGKVMWCRLVVDSNAPAFAYVELESDLLARQAVNQLSGRTILGYPLTLSTCNDTLERRVH